MPEPTRRKRAPVADREFSRRRDAYTEADGLFGRIADIVIENPVRAGGFAMVVMAAGAIVTNAAYFQTARHPDPFFVTRAADPAPEKAAAPKAATPAASAVANDAPPLPTASPDMSAGLGSIVSDTQAALAALSLYSGPVDGKLGPQTRAAITAFETKAGLKPTGQPSPKLLAQMRQAAPRANADPASASDPVATGSIDTAATIARIRKVQTALNDIGYGPLKVDGKGGGDTSNAIRRFELDNGLELTGQAGDAVINKLVKIGAMKAI